MRVLDTGVIPVREEEVVQIHGQVTHALTFVAVVITGCGIPRDGRVILRYGLKRFGCRSLSSSPVGQPFVNLRRNILSRIVRRMHGGLQQQRHANGNQSGMNVEQESMGANATIHRAPQEGRQHHER